MEKCKDLLKKLVQLNTYLQNNGGDIFSPPVTHSYISEVLRTEFKLLDTEVKPQGKITFERGKDVADC